jgi:hypothetical protein
MIWNIENATFKEKAELSIIPLGIMALINQHNDTWENDS